LVELFADVGGGDCLAFGVDEVCADILGELLDLHIDSGLGDVEFFAGFGEAGETHNCFKAIQLFECVINHKVLLLFVK